MSELERAVIAEVQSLPLAPRPYGAAAQRLGISEEEVLATVIRLVERGVIKRIGPSIAHRKLGFSANPMTAVKVPEDEMDQVGAAIAAEPGVTHCYAREGWDYNLFFMIHGKDREEAAARAEDIVQRAGGYEHRLLFSVRELKKTSFTLPPIEKEAGP